MNASPSHECSQGQGLDRSQRVLGDVFVNAEGLVFRRGRIRPETFALPRYAAEYRRPAVYSRFLIKNHWLRRGSVRVPSALWAIDNVSGNYFHWVVESLPRLLRAEACCADEHVLLLPWGFRDLTYVPFTLRAFPSIERMQWIGPRFKVRVDRLAYVPRLPRQPPEALPNQDELDEVVRRVSGLAGERGTARRIYFSRADASPGRRQARNEDEVARVLRAHDFEVIVNDLSRPWEQVQASLGADVMVGVHGAALTNVMFMGAGARLLELRHPVHHWKVYGTLARRFGIEYRSQMCEPASTERTADTDHDVVVDLDLLRQNLRELL